MALYLPTLTAIRFNPVLKLVAAGKPKIQAVGAWMRKLVMIGYEVLRTRAPFDPAWVSRVTH
jgi:transposase